MSADFSDFCALMEPRPGVREQHRFLSFQKERGKVDSSRPCATVRHEAKRFPGTRWRAGCSQGLCCNHLTTQTARLAECLSLQTSSAFLLLKRRKKRRQGQISGTNSAFIIEFGSLASGNKRAERKREGGSRERSSALGSH